MFSLSHTQKSICTVMVVFINSIMGILLQCTLMSHHHILHVKGTAVCQLHLRRAGKRRQSWSETPGICFPFPIASHFSSLECCVH